MAEGRTQKIKIENGSIAGTLWFGGWLFTLGFLELTFWKGLLALLVWPYYLGEHFSDNFERLGSLLM